MKRAPKTTPPQNDVVEGEVVEVPLKDTLGLAPVATLAVVERAPLAVSIELPSDENPVTVYLSSLAIKSRRVMLSDLQTIAGILSGGTIDAFAFSWGAVRFQHSAAIRSALAERYTHTGANRMLSALRGVLKAAWRLGQIPTDEYQRAIDVGSIKGESLPAGRALSSGELRTFFNELARQDIKSAAVPSAVRDAAMIAVLYGAGVRRDEIAGLDLADFNPETGALTVRHGKGNKARIAYATNGSADALNAWLEIRGDEAGALFCPVLKSGRIVIRRMTGQAVYSMLAKRSLEAGVSDVSPHDFRHTFISDLLDAGADIVTTQKLAGHADVTTTAKYDRRGEATKKKAAELLFVPFSKR